MSRKYYLEHREELLKKAMLKYHQNKEKIQKRRRELYQKNKDEINRKRRERHATDEEYREKGKQQDRRYYRNNKEKVLKSRQRYYRENRKQVDKAHKIWAKNNPELMREFWKKRKQVQMSRGFIPLLTNPFPAIVNVDFHHVYPWFPFTIPMPRRIHQTYNMELEKHIEHNKLWFEKLYSMDVDCLLGIKPFS